MSVNSLEMILSSLLIALMAMVPVIEGLNCSECVDFRNVAVLKNTVKGLDLGSGPPLPSNPKCETAVNGVPIDGVESITCPKNRSQSDGKVYRCVAYRGQVVLSSDVNFGESSGKVQVGFDGTYRSCLLQNVEASNSCENPNSELASDDPFRAVILESVPDTIAIDSVTFKGKKCVSDEAGRLPQEWKEIRNEAKVLKLNLNIFFGSLLITSYMYM